MSPTEYKQRVTTDSDLTANARLIMNLVVDYHQMDKGCVMKDSTIAKKIGISTRTAERRLKELREAGYLRAVHGANRRQLVPEVPDKHDGEADTDVETPDTRDVATDTDDGDATDTSVVHRDIDISANAGEGAPTREDTEITFEEELTMDLVDAWRSVRGSPALTKGIEDTLFRWAREGEVTDAETFENVLRDAVDSTAGRGVGIDLAVLRDEYQEAERKATAKYMPSSDPDLDV
jgi:hypothetical protein